MAKSTSVKSIAIVFGREESGLTNDEISLCHTVTNVPMKTKYPSLNLAQSVMIYAYTLSMLEFDKEVGKKQPSENEFNTLKSKVETILTEIGFKSDSAIYNRIMERLSILGETDIHLLHSVCNKLNEKK
ncbi:MAG: TrmH family RNA methyltransferase [Bacteroidales bacterium]